MRGSPRLQDVAHPLSLWFHDRVAEREFRLGCTERSLPQVRISLVLGALIYAGFGLLDPFIIPDVLGDARLLRFTMVIPALLLGYAATFTPFGQRHLTSLQVVMAGIGGIGVTWFATRRGELAPLLYGAGVPLVCVYAATFMRLPFIVASATVTPFALLYLGLIAWMGHLTVAVLLSQVFFTVSFCVAALSASYAIEWHERTSFLQRRTIAERTGALQRALDSVTTLSRLLPMCAWCRKVRDDQGYWDQVEGYLARHAGTSVSHSICPDCAARLDALDGHVAGASVAGTSG